MKIIFESRKYYDALWEIQSQIRNKLKWEKMTDKEYCMLEWVSDMMCEELNERGLHHFWYPKDEL